LVGLRVAWSNWNSDGLILELEYGSFDMQSVIRFKLLKILTVRLGVQALILYGQFLTIDLFLILEYTGRELVLMIKWEVVNF